jgi:hypothetical protein
VTPPEPAPTTPDPEAEAMAERIRRAKQARAEGRTVHASRAELEARQPTTPDRARLTEIESRHRPQMRDAGTCGWCFQQWPCDNAYLLAALRAAEAAGETSDG